MLTTASEPDAILTLTINGIEVQFNGELAQDDPLDYAFAPTSTDEAKSKAIESWTCEVCGGEVSDDQPDGYLVGGSMTKRCPVHAEGTAIDLPIVRVRRLPEIKQREPAPVRIEVPLSPDNQDGHDGRKKLHKLMVAMKEHGLSYAEISRRLTEQGFREVKTRTVAKHLRGECACLQD